MNKAKSYILLSIPIILFFAILAPHTKQRAKILLPAISSWNNDFYFPFFFLLVRYIVVSAKQNWAHSLHNDTLRSTTEISIQSASKHIRQWSRVDTEKAHNHVSVLLPAAPMLRCFAHKVQFSLAACTRDRYERAWVCAVAVGNFIHIFTSINDFWKSATCEVRRGEQWVESSMCHTRCSKCMCEVWVFGFISFIAR